MIEISISLAILSICIICTFSMINSLINSNNNRLIKNEINNSLYAICSEIKYNISCKEIKNQITDRNLELSYHKNLLKILENSPLLNLDRSYKDDEKVVIKLLEDKENYMVIKVKIIYKEIEEEQNILKADWMDYV